MLHKYTYKNYLNLCSVSDFQYSDPAQMLGYRRSQVPQAISTAAQLQCPHCPEILYHPSTRDLNAHIAIAHPDVMPFKCDLCGKGYMTSAGLHHHKAGHSGKQFVCPVCSTTYTQKYNMKTHLKNVHHAAQCVVCFNVFKIGPEFDSHVLVCRPV